MSIINTYPGIIVLNVSPTGIYAAKGYRLYRSTDLGKSWQKEGFVKDGIYSLAANSCRLLARLLRTEITELHLLSDGSRIAIAKKGIFRAQEGESEYKKVFSIPRGTRPLNLCVAGDGTLYFGEYFSNKERKPVHIYCSKDQGQSWSVCYSFRAHSIRHVHGVYYDNFEDKVWFSTGDLEGECQIGYTKDGFETVEIFKEGGQQYRTVEILFFKDYILYGTDTEYEKNYIYKIERKSAEEERLQPIQSSVLSASGNGEYAIIATAVEPSAVNKETSAYLWMSRDALQWVEIGAFEKDDWNPKYFQYGRVKFPVGALQQNSFFISGHALKEFDNSSMKLSL